MTCEPRGNTNTYCTITAHTLLPFNNNRVFKWSLLHPLGAAAVLMKVFLSFHRRKVVEIIFCPKR